MGRGTTTTPGLGTSPRVQAFFLPLSSPHFSSRSTKAFSCSTSYHVHFLYGDHHDARASGTYPGVQALHLQISKPPLPKTLYAIQRTLNVQLLYTTRNPKSNLKNNDNILPPITLNKRTYLPILLFWVILPKANNTGPFPLLPHRRHLIIYPIRRHPPLRT